MADIQEAPFNLIIPSVFSLSSISETDKRKIRDEVMDKVSSWERRMGTFFKGYSIAADSWRIRPDNEKRGVKTLFNSKSGETHRGAETLASVWHRMLLGGDPWFDATKRGLNPDGSEVTEEQLYASMEVQLEQQRASQFKRKLFRSLRSTALFGISFVEEPFISLPYGSTEKYIEYTDWVHRPLVRVGFDTTVYDVVESDYIFFIDFLSKYMLLNQSSQDTDHWDQGLVEKHIKEYATGDSMGSTDAYSRLAQSRSRAGYVDTDAGVYETISYHGRLDPENSVLSQLLESMGVQADPKYVDFSVSILDGKDLAKLHMTQYGDWRTRAKVLTYKDFEDEPLPYGVGQLGRKLQREMDITESLVNDKATFDVLNMWKIGKYSGYDQKQFIAEPMKAIELEDISQMAPLVGDPNVLGQMLSLIGIRREDFRDIVGAKTNLQGQVTKASATESAIAQNESIRSAGVHAEILAEVLRAHLEISHINNLNYLDDPIWVGITGSKKTLLVDKNKLPINIGFIVKVITDRDFRPGEIQNITQALQILSSASTIIPSSVNASVPLIKQLFRKLGLNPAELAEPIDVKDQMEMKLQRMLSGKAPEAQGLMGQEANTISTPMGPVETSNVKFPEVSA